MVGLVQGEGARPQGPDPHARGRRVRAQARPRRERVRALLEPDLVGQSAFGSFGGGSASTSREPGMIPLRSATLRAGTPKTHAKSGTSDSTTEFAPTWA